MKGRGLDNSTAQSLAVSVLGSTPSLPLLLDRLSLKSNRLSTRRVTVRMGMTMLEVICSLSSCLFCKSMSR